MRIAVADRTTYRKLQGNWNPGEKPGPSSLVLLQTYNQDQRDGMRAQSQILAKRFDVPEAISILVNNREISINPWQWQEQNDTELWSKLFDDYGMILHDPDMPPFQHEYGLEYLRHKHAQATEWALNQQPSLPNEVIKVINDMVNEEMPLEELTEAPEVLRCEMKVIEVHALIPLADVDATWRALEAKVKTQDPTASVVLYPWKNQSPATRREFWRLWDRIISRNNPPRNMLACFLDSTTAAEDDTVIMVKWHNNDPAVLRQVGVEHAVPMWQRHLHPDHGKQYTYDLPNQAVKGAEIIYNPNDRFSNDNLSAYSHDPYVFFLTKKPPAKAIAKVKERLIEQAAQDEIELDIEDGQASYKFVEWEKDEDGDEQDMVRLAADCIRRQGGRQGQAHTIFVDRQTFEDDQVLFSK